MKFLRKEFIRNLLTHWRYNLLIFFALSVVVLIGYIIIYNQQWLNFRSSQYTSIFGNKRYYTILMTESSEASFYANPAIQNVAEEVRKELLASPYWQGYFVYGDSFLLEFWEDGSKKLPEYFEYGYEDGRMMGASNNCQALKAFSVSQEAFEIYDMKISQGRYFLSTDYTLKEETGWSSSVLLGSAYREFFNVGDVIEGNGYKPERNLRVVGFLEEGTLFASSDQASMIPLDRYIIFPIHKQMLMNDGFVMENPDIGANFSGFLNIVSKHNNQTVQNELDRITNAYGFPAIVSMQWGGSQIESTAIVSRRNVWLLTGLAVLLVSIAIVSMAFVLNKKTEKNMPTYAVYMLNGIRPRMIFLAIASEALLLSLLSVLPAIWISFLQFGELYATTRYVFYISVPVMILSLIPACRLIQKINLDQLARRKSE